LVSEQSIYSLQNRLIELEMIPACRAYGLGLIPYSPLAGGILGGMNEQSKTGRRVDPETRELLAKHRPQIIQYEAVCKQFGEPPAVVALAWLLTRPSVTAPIIGPRTMDQLKVSLRALEVRLDEPTMKALDTIWPGPGGEAPEAYAW